MIIEFSNAVPPKGHSAISVAIVVASCAFFFIPTTLIILGYLSSQPTGSLISPLPQGILSQSPTPTVTTTHQPITNNPELPLIAAPNEATAPAQTNVVPEISGNATDKTASVSAGQVEASVSDPDIKATSQIYLTARPGDSSIYSVKTKQEGQMIISVNSTSDTVRYIDYHIVNP